MICRRCCLIATPRQAKLPLRQSQKSFWCVFNLGRSFHPLELRRAFKTKTKTNESGSQTTTTETSGADGFGPEKSEKKSFLWKLIDTVWWKFAAINNASMLCRSLPPGACKRYNGFLSERVVWDADKRFICWKLFKRDFAPSVAFKEMKFPPKNDDKATQLCCLLPLGWEVLVAPFARLVWSSK